MPQHQCPPDEALGRYAAARLSDTEAAVVDTHLAECPHCLARLDILACNNGDALLAALRHEPASSGDSVPWLALPESELHAGCELAGYRLLELIGRGGMGQVWRARHARLDQDVAVKIIAAAADSDQVRSRFEAERDALARMDHPGIARVLDGGVASDGRPFFVMELVAGVPVTRYCNDHGFDVDQRLRLFIDICQAVQHAHHKGVIHRDLKPSNVLVAEYDDRPVPKVIDFGVAKALGPRTGTEQTEVGMLVGTPEYMSPEQAALDPRDMDTRSDVYSLGVLLHELLTGDTPFERDRLRVAPLLEVLRLIREEEPPPPSRKGNLGPRAYELDWIVLKALDKDRGRRYESSVALAQDVQRYLNDEPVAAGPPSRSYRLRKFVRRHRPAVLTGALVMLALLAGSIGTTIGLIQARRSAHDAQEAQQQALTERDIAEAVREFLQHDLLMQASSRRQANRGHVPHPDLRLREVLDRAAQRIPGRFDRHPLVEASIRHTIGDAYHEIGIYPAARTHLEAAIALFRDAAGPDDLRTLDAESSLVVLLLDLGRFREAAPLAQRVLAGRRRCLGPDHLQTLESWGHALECRGFIDEPATIDAEYEEALAVMRRVAGPDAPVTLSTLSNRGAFRGRAYSLERAEPLLREVYEVMVRTHGPDHLDTQRAASSLAGALNMLGHLDEADRLLKHALEVRQQALGEDHPETVLTRYHLAVSREYRGDLTGAAADLAPVAEELRRVLGPLNPHTLKALYHLGFLRLRTGDVSAAHRLLTEAHEGQRQVLGLEHPATLLTAYQLGGVYAAQRKYDLAQQLLTDTLAAQKRVLRDHHHATLATASDLANLLAIRGDYDRAAALLRETINHRARDPQDNGWLFKDLKTLVKIYQAAKRPDEADAALAEWIEHARHSNKISTMQKVDALAGLANNYLKRRQPTAAEPLLREALALLEREPPQWLGDYLRCLLGTALVAQKRYAEAEPLLLAGCLALEQRTALPANGRTARTNANRWVRQLYQSWDKPALAAFWSMRSLGPHGDASHSNEK